MSRPRPRVTLKGSVSHPIERLTVIVGSDGFREAVLRRRTRIYLPIAIDNYDSLPCERHVSALMRQATACPARKTFASRERSRQRVASDSVHVPVQCTGANGLELPLKKASCRCQIGYTRERRTRRIAVAQGSSEAIAVAALFLRRAFGRWKESSL